MTIAQRGSSSTTNGYGSVDRFACYYDGTDEAPTHAQVALTSSDTGPWEKGFTKAWQITNGNHSSGAGAADYIGPQYSFEGQDLSTSGWLPSDTNSKLTFSFWVKSSIAQTFYGRFRAYASSQYQYTYSFALSANTWTKVTKTIPGNANFSSLVSTTDVGLFHIWQCFYGTDMTNDKTLDEWAVKDNANASPDMTSTWYTTNDATFAITGVQLETGDTANEFQYIAPGPMKQRCLRYFWKNDFTHYSHLYHSSGTMMQIRHPVEMRVKPTIVKTGDDMTTWTSGGNTSDTKKCYRGYLTSNESKSWTASTFDSEL